MPILLKLYLFRYWFSSACLSSSQIRWFWCHRLGRGHVDVNIQVMAEEMLDGLSCLLEMSLQALWDMWVSNFNIYKIILNKCQMSYFDSTLKYVKIQYSLEVKMKFHILNFNKNDAENEKTNYKIGENICKTHIW